jgi:hypothetical protein
MLAYNAEPGPSLPPVPVGLARRGTGDSTARGAEGHGEVSAVAVFILGDDDPIGKSLVLETALAHHAVRRRSGPRCWWRWLIIVAKVQSWQIDRQAQGGNVDAETAQGLAGPTFDIEDPDQEVLRIDLGIAALK